MGQALPGGATLSKSYPVTEGTSRLRREYSADPRVAAGQIKAQAKAGGPGRRAKTVASRRGKARPPHVGRAVAHRGTRRTEETRRKMREAHRARGSRATPLTLRS